MTNLFDQETEFNFDGLSLDELTEVVATAQRELDVSEALLRDHKDKLRMAEDEVNTSRRRHDAARISLAKAAVAKHEAVHGKPVSFEDRMAFEQRWDAKVAERKAYFEAQRAGRTTPPETGIPA